MMMSAAFADSVVYAGVGDSQIGGAGSEEGRANGIVCTGKTGNTVTIKVKNGVVVAYGCLWPYRQCFCG